MSEPFVMCSCGRCIPACSSEFSQPILFHLRDGLAVDLFEGPIIVSNDLVIIAIPQHLVRQAKLPCAIDLKEILHERGCFWIGYARSAFRWSGVRVSQ